MNIEHEKIVKDLWEQIQEKVEKITKEINSLEEKFHLEYEIPFSNFHEPRDRWMIVDHGISILNKIISKIDMFKLDATRCNFILLNDREKIEDIGSFLVSLDAIKENYLNNKKDLEKELDYRSLTLEYKGEIH